MSASSNVDRVLRGMIDEFLYRVMRVASRFGPVSSERGEQPGEEFIHEIVTDHADEVYSDLIDARDLLLALREDVKEFERKNQSPTNIREDDLNKAMQLNGVPMWKGKNRITDFWSDDIFGTD